MAAPDGRPGAGELIRRSNVETVTVCVSEELEDASATCEMLAPAFVAPAGSAVVVDLSAVTYLTMEAVVPLMVLARRCFDLGQSLCVVASASAHAKLMQLGLTEVLGAQRRCGS
ncbi:hypothetical protein Amsp01_041330 [Amycolatopsis sp. NBRC 101858]|uniref:anti-sigma factor antagonist n=1 Tax=Amycolatopsis sp. NBRC 101858 TaxID=3032200 RepID=UPI0024A4EB2E|nr:anti-sigma factor antagonist [Amycolatopsis sp. NBRC 101858]GLY38109.1 hypothetical protein Amsp01_041330 [Amycolatopsis sp. NBRC 101858]